MYKTRALHQTRTCAHCKLGAQRQSNETDESLHQPIIKSMYHGSKTGQHSCWRGQLRMARLCDLGGEFPRSRTAELYLAFLFACLLSLLIMPRCWYVSQPASLRKLVPAAASVLIQQACSQRLSLAMPGGCRKLMLAVKAYEMSGSEHLILSQSSANSRSQQCHLQSPSNQAIQLAQAISSSDTLNTCGSAPVGYPELSLKLPPAHSECRVRESE